MQGALHVDRVSGVVPMAVLWLGTCNDLPL